MNHDPSRFILLHRTAWVCVLLVFSVVVSSAFIRLSTQGLNCIPWPHCYGQLPETARYGVEVVRVIHRFSALLLMGLLLLLIVRGFAREPEPWPARWLAVGMTVIAILLAVLGVWTAGSRLPAIALGNLLGGFVLFAVSVRMVTARTTPGDMTAIPTAVHRWRIWAACAVLLQTALGGMLGSSLSTMSCPSLPLCTLPEPIVWQILNPWHVPQPDLAVAVANPAGALLHWLHRGMALMVSALVLLTAYGLWRAGRRRISGVLLGLMLAQAMLGAMLVATEFPLLPTLLHNTLTALLLAALIAL